MYYYHYYWPGGGTLTGELTLLGGSERTVMGEPLSAVWGRSGRTLRRGRCEEKTVRKWKRKDFISQSVGVESSFVLTCTGCLGGGSLCAVEGKRCVRSPTLTPASEAVRRRRWGESWSSCGLPERTGGSGGWTRQKELWRRSKSKTDFLTPYLTFVVLTCTWECKLNNLNLL